MESSLQTNNRNPGGGENAAEMESEVPDATRTKRRRDPEKLPGIGSLKRVRTDVETRQPFQMRPERNGGETPKSFLESDL